MRKLIVALTAAAAMANVYAIPNEKATETVVKAFQCELPLGKFKSVIKAVKALGGAADKEVGGLYHLPTAVNVFGIPMKSIYLNNVDVESYFVILKGVKLADIGVAAKATKGGADYKRETKYGTIRVTDHEADVQYACEVVR